MNSICRALGVSRSNICTQLKQQKRSRKPREALEKDALILRTIKDILGERPAYGYRRITILLRKKLGISINHKKVYRLMKENQLLLQRHALRPQRIHEGKIITLKSNVRWCSDLFTLQCWNGDKVTIAFSKDCHDREIISWIASSKGIDGTMIRDLMAESVEKRFGKINKVPHPLQWLSDNGPQYVARDTVHFGRLLGLEICTTAPYSPESNGMAEAFVKTFKRDYAAFGDLSSAQIVIEQLPLWFEDYTERAPHKGLKMLSPREYRRQLAA